VTFSAFFQAVPPAPGRGDPGAGPQPGQTQPDGPSGSPPPGGALGTVFPLLLILPMILVMFFMSRSQQKKQKELESKLKVGDRVITQSGLIGKLTEKGEQRVKIEIAPGIKVQMTRSALLGLDTGVDEPAKRGDK
jgi:preprotein translocase subunit YajC